MFAISIENATTNPFRNERVFLCGVFKNTRTYFNKLEFKL